MEASAGVGAAGLVAGVVGLHQAPAEPAFRGSLERALPEDRRDRLLGPDWHSVAARP